METQAWPRVHGKHKIQMALSIKTQEVAVPRLMSKFASSSGSSLRSESKTVLQSHRFVSLRIVCGSLLPRQNCQFRARSPVDPRRLQSHLEASGRLVIIYVYA